jgi:aspartate 1-decarboxylase
MLRDVLKSKIHRATVTEACLEYEGSLGIDTELMRQADLIAGEKVLVANLSNGQRFETYVIEAERGEIILNGAAARLGTVGDTLIIMAFGHFDEAELQGFQPSVVHVDGENRAR